ncbi:hypothetical protein VNO77_25312 [Canavalia gladiata]|uniref:Uncharacterized protein n=1 Tax=Canavalia gladiata TaxID=3824 RepID=A0AAN9QGZ9_CANGL
MLFLPLSVHKLRRDSLSMSRDISIEIDNDGGNESVSEVGDIGDRALPSRRYNERSSFNLSFDHKTENNGAIQEDNKLHHNISVIRHLPPQLITSPLSTNAIVAFQDTKLVTSLLHFFLWSWPMLKTYQLTKKGDMYSFDVFLIELVSGRCPVEPKFELRDFIEGYAISVLDPRLDQTAANSLALEKILELGLQCILLIENFISLRHHACSLHVGVHRVHFSSCGPFVFIFSMILFALMILCQRFQLIEGRYLKYEDEKVKHKDHDDVYAGNSATNAAIFANVSPPSSSTMVHATGAAPPPGHDVHDFRPTTPGHSPGVGHSLHN